MTVEITERQEKSISRRATLFSLLAALSLLMCAAFADQIHTRLGVPQVVVFGMAGLGGVLILLSNLGSSPNNFSKKTFGLLSVIFLVDLLLLDVLMAVFAIKDSGGLNSAALSSIAIFAVLYVLTALSLRWLIAARTMARD